MNLIAAVGQNWELGKDNSLLFKIPQDMKFFRNTTMGATVIMGRKTLESFPDKKPLPKRDNIIMSRNKDYSVEGAVVCASVEELFSYLKKNNVNLDNVYVCGGEQIYRELLPFCKTAYITMVRAEKEADSFLPDFTKLVTWEHTDSSGILEDNGYQFSFECFENKMVVPF